MEIIVIVVLDRCNPAYRLAIAPGQEELGSGVCKKWMLLPVQQFFHVHDQRRNPIRIVPVKCPGKPNELPQIAGIDHSIDFDLAQGSPLLSKQSGIAWPLFIALHRIHPYLEVRAVDRSFGQIRTDVMLCYDSKFKRCLARKIRLWIHMDHPFRKLLPATILLIGIILIGILGYEFLEKWTFLESTYMVITTLFTVGFMEIHPLSPAGRIFTIFIIVLGVGSALYIAGQAVEIIIEGEMSGYRKRKSMDKKISQMKQHYIICGFGRVGHQVGQVFDSSRIPYVVIDSKRESLDELEAKDIPVIVGDATSDGILIEAGIQSAKGLIACSDSDVANVYVTLSARVLNPALNIVARAGIKDTEKKLIMAGANRVISPYFISGIRMAALAISPVASDFLDLVTHGGQVDFSLYEMPIPEHSPMVRKTIAEADIRGTSGALILAIRRSDGSFDLQPKADSTIEKNDVLVVIGTQEQFEKLQKIVHSE
jgi:voltage-gated potassium channel